MINDSDINNQDFFEANENLKEKYLIYYYSHPHWSQMPSSIHLVIDKDFSYELRIMWTKMMLKKRLLSIYKSNFLPESIIVKIKKLQEYKNIDLKTLYTSDEGKYSPSGLPEDYYYFNHKKITYNINMSSYYTNKELFQSDLEKHFLDLHNEISKWKEKLFEKIKEIHN